MSIIIVIIILVVIIITTYRMERQFTIGGRVERLEDELFHNNQELRAKVKSEGIRLTTLIEQSIEKVDEDMKEVKL